MVGHLLDSAHKNNVVEAGHDRHYAATECGAGGSAGVLDPHSGRGGESSPTRSDGRGMGLVLVCFAHLSDEGRFDVLARVELLDSVECRQSRFGEEFAGVDPFTPTELREAG